MAAPKLKPGDSITWKQYHTDGRVTVRTGTVIDRAPRVRESETGPKPFGNDCQLINWWVKPDEKLSTDLYEILAVGHAAKVDAYAHGRYLRALWGDQFVAKGDLYSSDAMDSPLGSLAVKAYKDSLKNRQENGS